MTLEKALAQADPRLRPFIMQIKGDYERGHDHALLIIDVLRSHAQQQRNIDTGVSWTSHSLHLPQPPENLSLAVDFCPAPYTLMKFWNPTGAFWWDLGQIVKSFRNPLIGISDTAHLRSGMDWHDIGLPEVGKTRSSWDPGHVELRV